jgi:hypothetical protein
MRLRTAVGEQLKRQIAVAEAVISPARFIVKKRMTLRVIYFFFLGRLFLGGEDHVAGLLAQAAAFFQV